MLALIAVVLFEGELGGGFAFVLFGPINRRRVILTVLTGLFIYELDHEAIGLLLGHE